MPQGTFLLIYYCNNTPNGVQDNYTPYGVISQPQMDNFYIIKKRWLNELTTKRIKRR